MIPPVISRFYPGTLDETLCDRQRSPEAMFPEQYKHGRYYYLQANNKNVLLIQTDGACLENGMYNPRAGLAFIYGPNTDFQTGCVETTLGREDATSNRAELKAVISALEHEHWEEIFGRVVIATDSEYIVKGCTEWCRNWARRGWRTANLEPVKNQDLWENLIWWVDQLSNRDCEVVFWKIPREWNSKADAAAKRAAAGDGRFW